MGTERPNDGCEKKEGREGGKTSEVVGAQRVQRADALLPPPSMPPAAAGFRQIKELCERCLEAGAAATTLKDCKEALHACDGDLDCAFAFLVGESVSAAGLWQASEEGKADGAVCVPGEAPRLPRGAPGPLGRRRRSSLRNTIAEQGLLPVHDLSLSPEQQNHHHLMVELQRVSSEDKLLAALAEARARRISPAARAPAIQPAAAMAADSVVVAVATSASITTSSSSSCCSAAPADEKPPVLHSSIDSLLGDSDGEHAERLSHDQLLLAPSTAQGLPMSDGRGGDRPVDPDATRAAMRLRVGAHTARLCASLHRWRMHAAAQGAHAVRLYRAHIYGEAAVVLRALHRWALLPRAAAIAAIGEYYWCSSLPRATLYPWRRWQRRLRERRALEWCKVRATSASAKRALAAWRRASVMRRVLVAAIESMRGTSGVRNGWHQICRYAALRTRVGKLSASATGLRLCRAHCQWIRWAHSARSLLSADAHHSSTSVANAWMRWLQWNRECRRVRRSISRAMHHHLRVAVTSWADGAVECRAGRRLAEIGQALRQRLGSWNALLKWRRWARRLKAARRVGLMGHASAVTLAYARAWRCWLTMRQRRKTWTRQLCRAGLVPMPPAAKVCTRRALTHLRTYASRRRSAHRVSASSALTSSAHDPPPPVPDAPHVLAPMPAERGGTDVSKRSARHPPDEQLLHYVATIFQRQFVLVSAFTAWKVRASRGHLSAVPCTAAAQPARATVATASTSVSCAPAEVVNATPAVAAQLCAALSPSHSALPQVVTPTTVGSAMPKEQKANFGQIKALHARTGKPFKDCKDALNASGLDADKAYAVLMGGGTGQAPEVRISVSPVSTFPSGQRATAVAATPAVATCAVPPMADSATGPISAVATAAAAATATSSPATDVPSTIVPAIIGPCSSIAVAVGATAAAAEANASFCSDSSATCTEPTAQLAARDFESAPLTSNSSMPSSSVLADQQAIALLAASPTDSPLRSLAPSPFTPLPFHPTQSSMVTAETTPAHAAGQAAIRRATASTATGDSAPPMAPHPAPCLGGAAAAPSSEMCCTKHDTLPPDEGHSPAGSSKMHASEEPPAHPRCTATPPPPLPPPRWLGPASSRRSVSASAFTDVARPTPTHMVRAAGDSFGSGEWRGGSRSWHAYDHRQQRPVGNLDLDPDPPRIRTAAEAMPEAAPSASWPTGEEERTHTSLTAADGASPARGIAVTGTPASGSAVRVVAETALGTSGVRKLELKETPDGAMSLVVVLGDAHMDDA